MSKKFYIETYGCQMNVADSEVVAAIMQTADCSMTDDWHEADIILLNTCSIRDNAEQKVVSRLRELRALTKRERGNVDKFPRPLPPSPQAVRGSSEKSTTRSEGSKPVIGVIGCMAERMGEELIRDFKVDFVAGPDAYMDIPNLLAQCELGQKAMNIELSKTETYREVMPARIGKSISGF
ncbi:MAG: hypothetical protein ACI4TV_02835, partial [Paludibacteraceae bacterium]